MTTLHSFIDIFDSSDDNAIQLKKIVVPIIQRDYAQGRKDPEVDRVRERFLDALYSAVTKQPITLDFVYGDIDKNGVMTPLDGQQRLTTLFLLHWYAAKKEMVEESEYSFLKRFSYATRYSARNFCEKLVDFNPEFEGKLSEEIIDQPWFPLDWKKDPTISAMLVMLDDIAKKFKDVDDLWSRLKGNSISFYFLPIRDMGLTDELYIKMNSRGKPLTRFEHFKAELEKEMKAVDEKAASEIIAKFDRQWLDLFWAYRNGNTDTSSDDTTDDEFLNYFAFICDVICYRRGESAQSQSHDEFDLIRKYFSKDSDLVRENMDILEKSFDCWCDLPERMSPEAFLNTFMSAEHENGKIRVDRRYRERIDIFEDCLHSYSGKSGRQRAFPLNRFVILFAINCYLQHRNAIDNADFRRRMRIINNLVKNSDDEIADRSERNRMPAIIEETEHIMLTGEFDDSIDNHFNGNQVLEEKAKIEFLKKCPDKAEDLFKLEDHERLYGQIGIIGTENVDLADRFASLFRCDRDKIDRAMMSVGDYGQRERAEWRRQYGSSRMNIAWEALFHKGANNGEDYNNTSDVLIKLLKKRDHFNDHVLDQIADEFVQECEGKGRFPWRYYYVKYPLFRPGKYGKIGRFKKEEPYSITIMQTNSYISENSYSPYLKEADPDGKHLDKASYGARLVFGDKHIISKNSAFVIRDNETEEVIDTVDIRQDENGIDTEDRIVKLKAYIGCLGNTVIGNIRNADTNPLTPF